MYKIVCLRDFPGGSVCKKKKKEKKNPPAIQEPGVPSLGQEDPLEKEIATHSNILAWEIPWTKDGGRLQSVGLYESRI